MDLDSDSTMYLGQMRQYCVLDQFWQSLMKSAMRQRRSTVRAYHCAHKLNRTIVDFAGSEVVTQVHLAEALQYWLKMDLPKITLTIRKLPLCVSPSSHISQ